MNWFLVYRTKELFLTVFPPFLCKTISIFLFNLVGSHRESMYGKGMRCKWLVSGHNTTSLKKIMLKVNYFNLIGFDYLMVYEVKPSTDEKILIGKCVFLIEHDHNT